MALHKLTTKAVFYNAIVNHFYEGLSKEQIKELNNLLLDNNLTFCDVKKVSEPYFDDASNLLQDFYFKA
jgi:hypothetical protein